MAAITETDNKGAVFTNVSSRLYQIANLEIKPGDRVSIPGEFIDGVRRAPAVKSGDLVEGEAQMPALKKAQKPSVLPDELSKALAYIKVEDAPEVLHTWAAAENAGTKRAEVMTAIVDRAKSLSK